MALSIDGLTPPIDGLAPVEFAAVSAALKRLDATADANVRRGLYADSKMRPPMPDISSLDVRARIDAVIGWPAKSVRSLSTLCRHEGIVANDGKDYGVDEWWDDNNLRVESSQAQDLSLIYGPAFLVTTRGDESVGEPSVLTTVCPATSGAGSWNPRTRRFDSFLSVHEVDDVDWELGGRPTSMTLYLPGVNVSMMRGRGSREWLVERREHTLPFVPVAPLVFQGRHDRPFGSARISRPVMSITDNAIKTLIRAEVGAEAYINPQRYLLGADMSQFADDNGIMDLSRVWRAMAGRMVAIGANEDTPDEKPIVPTMGQFPQLDMTPHLAQLESYAAQFAAETDLPVSSLGITHSQNPASAEAIIAAKDDLINLADKTTLEWSGAWEQSAMYAVMLRDGLSERPQGLRFRAQWRDPRTLSLSAAADAVVKLTSGDRPIIPPESAVALRRLGLPTGDIEQVEADRKRLAGESALSSLAAQITASKGA